jgi:hypothetical protein
VRVKRTGTRGVDQFQAKFNVLISDPTDCIKREARTRLDSTTDTSSQRSRQHHEVSECSVSPAASSWLQQQCAGKLESIDENGQSAEEALASYRAALNLNMNVPL